MEYKFQDLHTEVVKHLCEIFIDDANPLGSRNKFINNPQLDFLIFDIFIHQLWGKPEYEESIAEFRKAEKAVQNAFDDLLRDTVYDILYKARCGS